MENRIKPISFIIPSRNNLKYLKWCYAAIRKNQAIQHEICIADDASNDGTWDWVKSIKQTDPNITAIRNTSGTRLGHTILYDELIKRATNDVVMIWHADMYFCPGADVEIDKLINPKTIVSLTRIEPPLHPTGPEKILQDFGTEPENFDEEGCLNLVAKLAKDNYSPTCGIFAPWAVYKQDFLGMGGHDPLFAPQSKEDSDAFQRFYLQGVKFVQTWKGFCYHLTCRGSRFNPLITTPGKNSTEWENQNYKAGREFIRKWGTPPMHDSLMKPLVVPKYNILGRMKNADYEWLTIFEPWFTAVESDVSPFDKDRYVKSEQLHSRFEIEQRVFPKPDLCHDVIIDIDCTKVQNDIFNNLMELPNQIDSLEVGSSYQIDEASSVTIVNKPIDHVLDNVHRTWSRLVDVNAILEEL